MSNEVTEEEARWMEELRAAAVQAGLLVPNRFWLASFAIVSKGDVKKGLKRMKNWAKVEEEFKLSEVSEQAATQWFRETFPNLVIPLGQSKSGRLGYGVRIGLFDPSLVKTHQDWQYMVKTITLNLQSVNPTISHVRNGIANVAKMTGVGFKNISPSVERRMSSVYQDAFPVRIKEIYMIDPPSILNWILKIASLFLKKKLVDRMHPIPADQALQFWGASAVPPDMGGTLSDDWFDVRSRGLAHYYKSVAEMEGGQN